jgi:hypothetical protein
LQSVKLITNHHTSYSMLPAVAYCCSSTHCSRLLHTECPSQTLLTAAASYCHCIPPAVAHCCCSFACYCPLHTVGAHCRMLHAAAHYTLLSAARTLLLLRTAGCCIVLLGSNHHWAQTVVAYCWLQHTAGCSITAVHYMLLPNACCCGMLPAVTHCSKCCSLLSAHSACQ